MQTAELSGQAQSSSPSIASEEEKLAPSAEEALKEIKEATGAKNKEVGQRPGVAAAAASLCLIPFLRCVILCRRSCGASARRRRHDSST